MESLSRGFCAEAVSLALTKDQMEVWFSRWSRPTLQIVDILRYPCSPTQHEFSRFYLALSDARTLVWGVVPPEIELENRIAKYDVDIGCCITLEEYQIVVAPNSLNVLIILRASFSGDSFSLLGFPHCDVCLFDLSSRALIPKHQQANLALGKDIPVFKLFQNEDEIVLRDLIDHPECTVVKNNWWIKMRIVWKQKELPASKISRARYQYANQKLGASDFLRCLGVDLNGDAIYICLGLSLLSTYPVDLQDCLQLSCGSVSWVAGGSGLPHELQFREHAVIRRITDGAQTGMLSVLPHGFVGALQGSMRSVRDIIENAAYDEIVNIDAFVRHVDTGTLMNTKRGRVLRVVLTLEEEAFPEVLDVILWGAVAEDVEPKPEERWCFSNCTVRKFMRKKNLSSRSNTFAVRMHPQRSKTTSFQRAGESDHTLIKEEASQGKENGGSQSHLQACGMVERSLCLVVSIQDASPTLPALVRIQGIEVPLTRSLLTHSYSTPTSLDRFDFASAPKTYENCAENDNCESFVVVLHLSDTIHSVRAVGYTAVGESLFGITESEFISKKKRCPEFEKHACNALIGSPIAVWLIRQDSGLQLLLCCRHLNLTVSCNILLSSINEIMCEG